MRMYISEYSITSGKDPLLRIYNATTNSILSGASFVGLGGKYNEWISIDILPLLKSAVGILDGESLAAFTLLYRFYGVIEGTIYFDSLTIVANGDIYDCSVPEQPEGNRATDTVRGTTYYKYTADEFSDAVGVLDGGETAFMSIDESCYSITFNLTPTEFNGTLYIFGYTNESEPQSGISVCLIRSSVSINKASGTVEIAIGQASEVEIGFVGLFNGNTVYVFVKVDGKLVAWELVESYGKTVGNIAIVSKTASDSFSID